MIPFVMSFEDYVEGVDGVMDQYTYRIQYMGKMYYVSYSLPFEEMSVIERQNACLSSFAECFTIEQQEKLDQRPSDIDDMIDDTLRELGLEEDDDDTDSDDS